MSARIHPSAVVEAGARLGDGTVVGAFAFIGASVTIGRECWVGEHAHLTGNLHAGDRNRFFPYASVGALSQDLWRPGEESWVILGDDNVIREHVTINRGTSKEECRTSIGSRNNIMAGCHIAHDCVLGDEITMANNVLLGGHVRVRTRASLGGAAALHHFVTVGEGAFIGGLSRVIHDVPPWLILEGNPARLRAVNVVGARRHGISEDDVVALREAFRHLYGKNDRRRSEALIELAATAAAPAVRDLVAAIQRQTLGGKGRYLERFRRDDRTVDVEALDPIDRPAPAPTEARR